MRRILIVPDTILAELSSSFLDRRSYNLRTAQNATEALSLADVWSPDLLIFSSSVSDISPRELSNRFRSELDSCKLLMLTDEVGLDLSEVDVDTHLVQPFDQHELLKAVGNLLETEVRRADRLAMGLLLTRIHEGSGDAEEATLLGNVLELSETGMLVETERHLALSQDVTAFMVLPGQKERLALSATVVSADELRMRYAFKFTAAPEEPNRTAVMIYVDLQLAMRAEVTQHRSQG